MHFYRKNNPKQILTKFLKFIKLALFLFITINILGPVVVYVWPNIMSHMIFETFSKFLKCLQVYWS